MSYDHIIYSASSVILPPSGFIRPVSSIGMSIFERPLPQSRCGNASLFPGPSTFGSFPAAINSHPLAKQMGWWAQFSIKTDTRSAGACTAYSVRIGHELAKMGVHTSNKREKGAVATNADQLRHQIIWFLERPLITSGKPGVPWSCRFGLLAH